MSSRPTWRLVMSFVVVISCYQVLRSIKFKPYIEDVPVDTSFYVDSVESTKDASESKEELMLEPAELATATSETSVKLADRYSFSIRVNITEQMEPSGSLASLKQIPPSEPSNQKSLITLEPSAPPSFGIQIDANSTISQDIASIWHDVENGAVCVNLKESARCRYPALLGRLSGPALAILDWKDRTTTTRSGTVLCGDYSNKWLDAGEYFVEIIILYCEDFGVRALERVNNETIWLNTDFKNKCPEDSMHNRITSREGSKISITQPREGSGNYHLGRWVRREGMPSRPLFTRHQPVGCTDPKKQFKSLEPLPKWCQTLVRRDNPNAGKALWRSRKGATLAGLPEYEFQWRMNFTEEELVERLQTRLNHTSKPLPKICGIGDSHSRMMEERSLRQLNLTGIFEFIQSYWIAPRAIAHKVVRAKCDKLFVQIGQWAPSWYTRGKPFSFKKYHKKMKQHVENALKVLEKNTDAKIYLPTIDQGPMMGRVNACNDWRTPTVQDGYSYVLQIIQRELRTTTKKVEYIDTNFIIYTHWDGHLDWTHLLEDVRYRKTIYILALILGELSGLGDS